MLQAMLTKWGYEVVVTEDGNEENYDITRNYHPMSSS
jgi:hypothetical protein